MSDPTATTLTTLGLAKQAIRFVDSISHATYMYEGEQGEIPLFRCYVDGNIIRLYVYFDDSFTGEISEVRIIDKDGDAVIASSQTYTKAPDKGFYVAFKYKTMEEVVDSVESL